MQISIDTSRDSKDDIVKAIRLLQSIIGESQVTTQMKNIFSSPSPDVSPQPGSVFGSFFDNLNQSQPSSQNQSILKKDSQPLVELY